MIVAETGGDTARFASARHLASWAGVCPGHHESAGRTKSTRVRPGNPYLKGTLGLAAFGAVRTKGTCLQVRYKRIAARRGSLGALVAVEHSIITVIWHMLTDNVIHRELGGAYFTQRDPERATRRAIDVLNQLGYTVTLNPRKPQPDRPTTKHPQASAATGHPALPKQPLTWTYLRVRGPKRACLPAVERPREGVLRRGSPATSSRRRPGRCPPPPR